MRNTIANLRVFLSQAPISTTLSVLATILVMTVFEAGSVGLVVPLISLAFEPEKVLSYPPLAEAYAFFGIESPKELVLWVVVVFSAFYAVRCGFTIFATFWQTRYVSRSGARMASELLRRYMGAPYVVHLQRDTAEMINTTHDLVNAALNNYTLSAITILAELVISVALVTVLFIADPWITTVVLGVVGVCGGAIYGVTRTLFIKLGRERITANENALRALQDGLRSIKEARVLRREHYFYDRYRGFRHQLARILTLNDTYNAMPRAMIEAVVVIAILIIIALVIISGQHPETLMATLAMLVVAAMRLMPSANRIVTAMNRMRFFQPSAEKLIASYLAPHPEVREIEDTGAPPVVFHSMLELRDVCFSYPNSSGPSLTSIDMTIRHGESVALVGPSGSGKTTLAELILGLLPPDTGSILVDGNDVERNLGSWYGNVGYVPQDIVLLNDTLRRNVAFGVHDEKIDEERIRNALRLARMTEVVAALPIGLDTVLGENGTRLSGGQRQRIGIARAVYHDPELIVLDEATSAMDSETERDISAAIDAVSSRKTLIIIAHRLSTVRKCDRLYFLQEGRIAAQGSFDELIAKNVDFKRLVALSNLSDT